MKRFLALASFCAIALTACQPPAGEEPIKVGYIGPLTGDAASYGADTLNGTQMKIAEVNAAGGIDGRPVQLIVEDGQCTATNAASAAQKLVNIDKVVAIFGGQCSSETLAIAPITEAAEVVLFSAVSSSPDIADAGDFVFRDYPSDAFKGVIMSQYMERQGYERVALLSENTDYAQGIRMAIQEHLPESMSLVFDEVFNPGVKDFRSLLLRLHDVDFDVFVINPQGDASIAPMVQQFRDHEGFTQDMLSQDVADSLTLGSLAGDSIEGMRLISVSSMLGAGEVDGVPFQDMFVQEYGDPQQTIAFVALAYDAAGVVLDAISAVGTDGPAIRDYLYNLEEYNGVSGTFHFDEKGEVIGIPYGLKEFQDGVPVEIEQIQLN